MASTYNIEATVKFAAPIMRYTPLAIRGEEPALTAANIALQTMLGPPFVWPWNRGTAPGALLADTQDSSVTLADFHFLEKCALSAPGAGKFRECEHRNSLSRDGSASQQPDYVSTFLNDGAGTITFRFQPPPDLAYDADYIYQRKPPLITSLACTWSPVPDEYGYIYNWLFLGAMAVLLDDARWLNFNLRGIAHLLGAQQGLSDTEKNIFIQKYLADLAQLQGTGLKTSQGYQGRQS